jgi:hypothetical protein
MPHHFALAEAGRMKLDVVWLSGAEAQAVVAKAFAPST